VMLQFNSPLRRKSYRWEAGEVVLVQAMITYTAPNAWPLGEVRLHLSDRQRVHLFTDHRLSDIDRLVAAIQMAFLGSARLSDLPTALV